MTGAETLLRTLLAHSIDLCFANPGTSELQFVSALDRLAAMRGILCLAEGVCAGAADGYFRIARRPAATLLHLGPGLANALSNLHNARKARSPLVNLVGEHSTQHLHCGAPLTADIEATARPFSGWVRTASSPASVGADCAEAIAAALAPPGHVATLIVPADFSWSPGGPPGSPLPVPSRPVPDREAIRDAARLLRLGPATGLLLSGDALLDPALRAVARIQAATGGRAFADRYAARLSRGPDLPPIPRVPYFPEAADTVLAGLRHLILVEAFPPVSFFGYPGRPSYLAPADCEIHTLAPINQDGTAALEMLAAELGAPPSVTPTALSRPPLPTGDRLTPEMLGAAVGALLPEQAILADEMISSGEAVHRHLPTEVAWDLLPVTGGSIGQGLPVAVGAAVAAPNRKVIALEADGSGMYTLQALWTMARERLDVVTVIFANRRYRILDVEMRRTGSAPAGPRAHRMLDLRHPTLDWVALAQGHGVEAARASTLPKFIDLFRTGLTRSGPFLIEALLASD